MDVLQKLKKKLEEPLDKFRVDFATRNNDYEEGYRTALKDIKAFIRKEENESTA